MGFVPAEWVLRASCTQMNVRNNSQHIEITTTSNPTALTKVLYLNWLLQCALSYLVCLALTQQQR